MYRASSGAGDKFVDDSPRAAGYAQRGTASELTPKQSCDILEKYASASVDLSYKPNTFNATGANGKAVDMGDLYVPHKTVGEAFNCYIFVEYDGALLVIDKHAAHERIIFEDLLKESRESAGIASQSLLLPITVLLSAEERAENIMNHADDGVIILMHDGWDNFKTVEAVKIVVPQLIEQGYRFVTISELFEAKGTTPESNSGVIYSTATGK